MKVNERAWQIWPVLVLAAHNRQTLTYEQLAKMIGVVPPPALGKLLEPIQRYCMSNKLPPLTALVVSKKSGIPKAGFTAATAADVPAAQEQVFDYDWPASPTPEKLN